ncbi:MAG: DUF502 domain-containing protein [Ignavibacteriales bacterium]
MKRIAGYFLEGLLFVIPLALTIYLIYIAFVKIDGLLRIPIPGVGLVTTLALITLIGFLASNFLTKRLLNWIDSVFARLPLVKLLYSSVKDLINAFVGDKKSFNQPALVSLTTDGTVFALGFITRESLSNFGLEHLVSVYMPQSYNFAGNLLLFPREQVTPLNVNSSEVMTFIVSGGVSGQ